MSKLPFVVICSSYSSPSTPQRTNPRALLIWWKLDGLSWCHPTVIELPETWLGHSSCACSSTCLPASSPTTVLMLYRPEHLGLWGILHQQGTKHLSIKEFRCLLVQGALKGLPALTSQGTVLSNKGQRKRSEPHERSCTVSIVLGTAVWFPRVCEAFVSVHSLQGELVT